MGRDWRSEVGGVGDYEWRGKEDKIFFHDICAFLNPDAPVILVESLVGHQRFYVPLDALKAFVDWVREKEQQDA